jgi:hypothetical protein
VTNLNKPGKNTIKNTITLLIGITLITLSFVFWYFTVAPVCSLATYSFNRPQTTGNIGPTNTTLIYLGHLMYMQQPQYNKTRPIDYSFNTSVTVRVTKGGPIQVRVYVGDRMIFDQSTDSALQQITCNSTLYDMYNDANRPRGVFQNIASSVSASLPDAFTGGTTPYMTIKNLSPTETASVTLSYTYSALYRNSNGTTLMMFIIGVVLVVVEAFVFLRILIKRIRS